uniref:F-box domain-containing protein n=1 Tax=Oryza barthii TaxID=65489 RepID=A0A0D3GX76_9ORYZ
MEASLQAKCARIRTLRLPDDLLDDYEFQVKSPIRYKSIFQSYLWSDGDEYLDRDYMDEDMDNYESRRRRRRRRRLPARDWAALPTDVMLHILGKLSAVQLLLGSAAARRAARDEPSLWRSVVVNGYSRSRLPPRCRLSFEEVARAAVRGSQGRCEAFRGRFVGGDDFILFLADSAPFLKSLRLILYHKITSVAFAAAIMKFPLLEELEVPKNRAICMPELVANLCPQIKHFRHTRSWDRYRVYNINRPGNDSQALAIASMRQLRSLQLFRDDMTNEGMMTILDNCPYLESIDIRSCRNLTMDGTLRARCAMIKTKTLYPCKPADEDEDFQPGSPISYCSTCAGNTDMDIGSESDFDDISGIDYDDDWYDSYCCDYLSDTEEADLAVHNRMLEKSMRRNWADLPLDAILTIFHKLDHIDILMAADQVCASWRRAARDEPTLWQRITMRGTEALSARIIRGGLACAAVRRSAGRCEAFCGEFAGDDGFLMYLAEQASCLKSLCLISCLGVSNEGIEEAIKQFPLLEELELSFCDNVTYKAYAIIGVTCGPQLKCLKLSKSLDGVVMKTSG